MTDWSPNQATMSTMKDFFDDLFTIIQEIIGVDEIISGCAVIALPGAVPGYATIAVRGYHLQVYYRGSPILAVGDTCLVTHLRDGNRYEVLGPFEAGGGPTRFFVQTVGGVNTTDAVQLHHDDWRGIELVDLKTSIVWGHWRIPDNYDDAYAVKIKVVLIPEDTEEPIGNRHVDGNNEVQYGQCDESWQTHFDWNTGIIIVDQAANHECDLEIDLDDAMIDDIIHLQYTRWGANVADTYDYSVWCPGWIVDIAAEPG